MLKPDVKNIIADSAEALFKKYDIENVTIQQIVDACGTSRTTFYRYFKDKYDLMNWVYKRNVDPIIKIYNDGKDIRKLSAEIFEFIKSKKEYFYYITRYNGQNSFFDFVTQYGYDYYETALKNLMKVNKLPYEYTLYIKGYCFAGGNFMIDCMRKNCVMDTDKFAEIIYGMMPITLKNYFN